MKRDSKGYYQFTQLSALGLVHGFSTKIFGNLSFKYGVKEEIEKNRLNFANAVGIDSSCVAQMELVHGSKVTIVGKNDAAELNPGKYLSETDALVTDISGVALWLLTGDCLPIIFYDPSKKVIGLAHSGWRGTVGKMATIVFTKMIVNFSCRPENIFIGFGPAIEKCHYQKLKPIFSEDLPEWKDFLHPVDGNKLAIDLKGFTVSQLLEVGAKKTNIFCPEFCVADHNDEFFSQQIEKAGLDKPGRFATVIQMT